MAKAPRRITILKPGPDGSFTAHEVQRDVTRKRKATKSLSMVEKIVRTVADVNAVAANTYLERHNKSSHKKRDGWMMDAPVNVVRSGLKGVKRVKLAKFF